MRIIDTHCHLYFPDLWKERKKIFAENTQAGVKHAIQIGCDEISIVAMMEMIKEFPTYHAVLGVHPCDSDRFGKKNNYHHGTPWENYVPKCSTAEIFFDWIDEVCEKNSAKIMGFGETGFDLYHRHTPELLKTQKKCFDAHLRLAKKWKKPVVIHLREAAKNFIDYWEAKNRPEIPGVVHCFSEGVEEAKIYTERFGFHLGIGGTSTYPSAEKIRQAIRETNIRWIVTETDAPFLVPHKKRKVGEKKNKPAFLPEVVECIAEIKNLPVEETAEILYENGLRLFGLGPN